MTSTNYKLIGIAFVIAVCGCKKFPVATDSLFSGLNKVTAVSEDQIDLQFGMARVAERNASPTEARHSYQRILEQRPNHPGSLHRLGVMLVKQDQLEEALKYFEKALESARKQSASSNMPMDFVSASNNSELTNEILSDLGYAQYLAGDLENAEKNLSIANSNDRSNERIVNNLAIVVGLRGDLERSLSLFRSQATEAEALASFAYVQTRVGDLDGAKSSYHRALDKDPSLKVAANGLLELHQKIQVSREPIKSSVAKQSREPATQNTSQQQKLPTEHNELKVVIEDSRDFPNPEKTLVAQTKPADPEMGKPEFLPKVETTMPAPVVNHVSVAEQDDLVIQNSDDKTEPSKTNRALAMEPIIGETETIQQVGYQAPVQLPLLKQEDSFDATTSRRLEPMLNNTANNNTIDNVPDPIELGKNLLEVPKVISEKIEPPKSVAPKIKPVLKANPVPIDEPVAKAKPIQKAKPVLAPLLSPVNPPVPDKTVPVVEKRVISKPKVKKDMRPGIGENDFVPPK